MEWGWTLKNGQYTPVTSNKEAAHANILDIILCNCKSGCEQNCDNGRSGLNYTVMCGYCAGHECANRVEFFDVNEEDIAGNPI